MQARRRSGAAAPFVVLQVSFLLIFSADATVKTRVVNTKYGSVQGLIRPLGQHLGDVEVYLGVSYASATIEEGRFAPTNSPTPWEGVKDVSQQPLVCPQLLPDVDDAISDLRSEYIRKIRPFLANQSEDCLTLSIYAPILGKLILFFS